MNSIILEKLIDKDGGSNLFTLKVEQTTVKKFIDNCDIINNNEDLIVYVNYEHCGKIPIYYKSLSIGDYYKIKSYKLFRNLIIEKGQYLEYTFDGIRHSTVILQLKKASLFKRIFCKTIRKKDFYNLYERCYGALCL